MNRQLFQYHPVIGHVFIPDTRARITDVTGAYLVRTNSAGFRDTKDFVPHKRPGTARVLVFGDSFTAGDGLSNEARYTHLLQGLVPDLEVYNFGLPGTGTDQHYLVYREFGCKLEHDVIVIGVFVDSIRRVISRYRVYQTQESEQIVLAKPYFTRGPEGRLTLHNVPVPREATPVERLPPSEGEHVYKLDGSDLVRRVVDRLGPHVKDQVQRLTRHQPFPAYDDPRNGAWLLLRGLLAQWIHEARVPVVILPIPFYRHIEGTASPDAYRERFGELHDPPRALVHDPLDDFLRFPARERRRFRFEHDPHMTAAGHEVLAASLAPVIETLVRGNGEVSRA